MNSSLLQREVVGVTLIIIITVVIIVVGGGTMVGGGRRTGLAIRLASVGEGIIASVIVTIPVVGSVVVSTHFGSTVFSVVDGIYDECECECEFLPVGTKIDIEYAMMISCSSTTCTRFKFQLEYYR